MATYTPFLNLEKPTTSERLDVLKINANWDKIDEGVSSLNSKLANMEAYSVVNFTPETGITNDLFIRRYGRVVVINGYLTGASALADNQLLGTIADGSRPIAPIRLIGGVAGAAYQVGDIAYVNVGTNGEIRVTTKSGNTYKTLYFSCSFIVQS